MAEQPFAGITVVEFGQFIAVPYCAQLLADGGARVIKVEPLEGEGSRSLAQVAPGETRHFIIRNRGKHTLPLDLRHPQARSILDALLAKADIVLTNLRPGLSKELGLDYGTLSAAHPRIITGNVTAFGERGPDAALAGMDLVVQARSGLMATMGRMKDGLPAAGESPIADYMAAVLLSFGLASALYGRERTGRGTHVDVSLLMAALLLQNNMMVRVHSHDDEKQRVYLERLKGQRESGAPYQDQAASAPGSRPTGMTWVYYRTYATADSAIGIACVSIALRKRFLTAIRVSDPLAEKAGSGDPALSDHYRALQTEIEGVMAARTSAEWQRIFNEHGVPAAEVRFPLELLDDPQTLENGYFTDLEHPLVGSYRVLASPVGVGQAGFRPAPPTPPFASETRAVLEGIGLSQDVIDAAIAAGATRDNSPFA